MHSANVIDRVHGKESPMNGANAIDRVDGKNSHINVAVAQPGRVDIDHLRSLAAELALADDRDRYRLARSIHDELCQTLNLLSLQLGMAQRRAPTGEMKASLVEMAALMKEAGRSAQKLMFDLSPPVLHVLGLLPAVQWLGEQIESRHGLKVHVNDDREPKELDEAANLLLFRAVRELIHNAVRHAKVSSVNVEMRRQGGDLVVAVDDRGVGFDAQIAHRQRTRGLPGVFAWVEYLGGCVEIRTAPGSGATVILTVPMREPATKSLS